MTDGHWMEYWSQKVQYDKSGDSCSDGDEMGRGVHTCNFPRGIPMSPSALQKEEIVGFLSDPKLQCVLQQNFLGIQPHSFRTRQCQSGREGNKSNSSVLMMGLKCTGGVSLSVPKRTRGRKETIFRIIHDLMRCPRSLAASIHIFSPSRVATVHKRLISAF